MEQGISSNIVGIRQVEDVQQEFSESREMVLLPEVIRGWRRAEICEKAVPMALDR